ncbi:MAG: indolepyruvate ferredoxin oxidoreductase family protein, partial [Hydrogenophaga sp.]|nr:indolepyruvate ferredoxin oxidoreductase family protein [Hydrogenophaga sp.]MDP3605532.1 indolepyruvate ferredoxin oxidoreductase family protein [Polaromonas sp.]
YKDEYEVARLHTDRSFHDKVGAMFDGNFKLNYHLAPPMIAKTNDKGELQKQTFGPWMLTAFRLLARFKGLRGSALDPFGRTDERKMERALIVQYEDSIEEILHGLNAGNHAAAVDVARIPELIKGYGHVKARHLVMAQQQWTAALAAFRQPPADRPQLAA